MKTNSMEILALVGCLALINPLLTRAQTAAAEKPRNETRAETKSDAHAETKADARAEKVTPLKIQVVLTEFEGEKKIKSMPYVTYVDADRGFQYTKMRIGTKVPVYTGKDGGMQYIDVGTNIDCRATHADAGNFRLEMVIERSWVEGEVEVSGEDKPDTLRRFKEPVIRQFKNEMELMLRDGQTTESTVATDPLSGKVLKIDVSLAVLK